MKCEEIKSKISFLPKGELLFDERQKVLNHLQSCSHCNKEYQDYLRMFYLIDKQVDINIPNDILKDFSNGIMDQVKNSNQTKYRINRMIWYAAAAVLIFIFVIPFFQHQESPITFVQESGNSSLTELIQNEDWETVLKKFEGKDIPEELIPVSLLLAKFNMVDNDLANSVISKKLGKKSKNINDLIQLLNEYQRYKSRISTIEISKYLSS